MMVAILIYILLVYFWRLYILTQLGNEHKQIWEQPKREKSDDFRYSLLLRLGLCSEQACWMITGLFAKGNLNVFDCTLG